METTSENMERSAKELLLPSANEPEAQSPRGYTAGRKRILLADSDEGFAALLDDLAERLGCTAVVARDFAQLEAAGEGDEPDVILLGLQVGDRDAVQVLRYLSERRSHAYVVLIGAGDVKILESAERLGRSHRLNMLPSLERPVSMVALRSLLRGVIDAQPSISGEELREGIRDRQFIPHFLPVVDLKGPDQSVVRAEVLARWNHPFHGMLAAGEFIDAAEEHECIQELTAALLVEALEQASVCRQNGHTLPISINVSTTSLNDLKLPDDLSELVSDHGFENTAVTLELTESAMAEDRIETLDILTRLRMKGFALSMDDFGTGYSTLLELVRLPFNEIKIDPRFVEQIGVRRESGIVIRSAIGLAHGLGMSVCAEGVEDGDTLEFLRGAGCDAAQGRHILKPVSGEDLLEYLATRKNPPARRAARPDTPAD